MNRLEKYNIFKQFFETSKECFTEFNVKHEPHRDLRNSHGFYVFPGSRNGRQDKTVVDICFGHRPHRTYTKIENGQIYNIADVAYGSSLIYQQIDTGDILVILYPAYTKKQKAKEAFIIIDNIKNTKKLLEHKYIFKHYKYLVCYLAVTSIECNSKLIDRMKINFLRMTKQYQDNNNVAHLPKIKKYVKNVIMFLLTVGLSGFMLTVFTCIANRNKSREQEIKIETIMEKQNEIINALDTLNIRNNEELFEGENDQLMELKDNLIIEKQDGIILDAEKAENNENG
jgi:hypothetical protein